MPTDHVYEPSIAYSAKKEIAGEDICVLLKLLLPNPLCLRNLFVTGKVLARWESSRRNNLMFIKPL